MKIKKSLKKRALQLKINDYSQDKIVKKIKSIKTTEIKYLENDTFMQ